MLISYLPSQDAESSELNEAATKVQATYRGHMTRKNLKAKAGEEGAQEVEAVEADGQDPNPNPNPNSTQVRMVNYTFTFC